MKRLVLLVALAFPAAAQPLVPEDYERILLPIAISGEVRGAFGTRWTAATWLFNDSGESIPFRPFPCAVPSQLPCETQVATRAAMRADVAVTPFAQGGGAFVYTPRRTADSVRFASTLRDLSRSDENAGTELPVVRERDFRGRIVLPVVPLGSNLRVALRVYGPGLEPMRAQLRIFDGNNALVDVPISLAGVRTAPPLPFPPHPSSFQILELVATYPQLIGLQNVRIEITPEFGGQTLWAFASITNNATQLVTTVRPQ